MEGRIYKMRAKRIISMLLVICFLFHTSTPIMASEMDDRIQTAID